MIYFFLNSGYNFEFGCPLSENSFCCIVLFDVQSYLHNGCKCVFISPGSIVSADAFISPGCFSCTSTKHNQNTSWTTLLGRCHINACIIHSHNEKQKSCFLASGLDLRVLISHAEDSFIHHKLTAADSVFDELHIGSEES